VTLDHAAHLARKASCKTCHGPGPIQRIDHFEPKVAHDRCIGCHKQEAKGPTGCRDCHVVKPSADAVAAKAPDLTDAEKKQRAEVVASAVTLAGSAPAAPPPAMAPAGAAVPATAAPSGGGAPTTAATAAVASAATGALDAGVPHLGSEDVTPRPFLRVFSLGFSVLGGPDQSTTTGPAIAFSTREDDVLLIYTLERGSSEAGARTLGLIGAGLTTPLFRSRSWSAFGALLGGFDAYEAPVGVAPAVALRAGAEWMARRTAFSIYTTAGTDLIRQTTKTGEQIGGFTFSIGASVGYVLGRD
jgi:hypothetical protein